MDHEREADRKEEQKVAEKSGNSKESSQPALGQSKVTPLWTIWLTVFLICSLKIS